MIDITTYSDIIGCPLEVTYYHYQNKRMSAKLRGTSVLEGGMLIGVTGESNGLDPDAAIRSYIDQIRGKTIKIGYGAEGKTFDVPENLVP